MKWALLLPLLFGAVSVGALHTLAPDHWAPFAALARARRWPAWRTTRVTVLCGFGHVTVSVLLGLVALATGIGLMSAIGQRMEAFAGLLLIAFGIGYAAWGIRRAAGEKLHGHTHRHYDHIHDESHASEWTLFALFSADPCVAVIPLLLASAPLGTAGATMVVVAYELATIGTMVALVLPARASLRVIHSPWLERHEHATAAAPSSPPSGSWWGCWGSRKGLPKSWWHGELLPRPMPEAVQERRSRRERDSLRRIRR